MFNFGKLGKSLRSGCVPSPLRRLWEDELSKRFIGGALWSLVGAIMSRALNITASMLVARLLGKEGFGEYGIIQGTVSMFGTFAGFGLGLTATKFIAEYRLKDPEKAGRIMGFSTIVVFISGGILALSLLFFSPWLAAKTLAAPHLESQLRIGSLLMFLNALGGAQTGALVGLEAFKVIARMTFYIGVATFPLVVGGVIFFKLDGALWGLVSTAGMSLLLNHVALKQEARRNGIHITYRGSLRESGLLWSFSIPAVISGILAAPINWACSALLVNEPNGYKEMGVVNAANQIYYALLFLPGVISSYTIPILSERFSSGDKSACRLILRYSISFNVAIIIPIVMFGCLASGYIMSLYGAAFVGDRTAAIVAMVTAGVLAIQMPMGQIAAASGKMWTEICMNLLWALVFFFGTHISLSKGAVGLLSARLIAYLFHTLLTIGFVIWVLGDFKKTVHETAVLNQK